MSTGVAMGSCILRRLLRRGEFAPGLPYAYVADPDGYEIEIWFE
jgi:hypothetical protein